MFSIAAKFYDKSMQAKKEEELIKCKAIIFDMDGTIVQSTEADYLAWKMVFEEHERKLSFEDYGPLLGIRSVEVARKELGLEGDAQQDALQKKLLYFEEIIAEEGIKPVPYVEDLLKHLKASPVKLALATSSRRKKMELVMKKLNLLRYFEAIVSGEDVLHGKPAPDIFLIAAERLELKQEECIVIEDAAMGVKAAKNAGMKCIAITTTHTKELLQNADLIIDSYEGLTLQNICS